MDEIIEAAELIVDLGLEGVVAWVLRVVGLIALLGGAGLWLLTDMGFLVVPGAMMGIGVILLVAPSVVLLLAELGG
ncbi:MAG: hypothetical protein SV760_03580 [Halobacteria archaeon]|nr:hypothetical protein [Halobacteria archaeon]